MTKKPDILQSINDFIFENSLFLSLQDGESFEGIYKGYEIVPSTFDPEKTVLSYTFEINETEKPFKSGSLKLAQQMKDIKEGTKVEISRSGEGPKTTYQVKIIE